ncbi:MAG: lanthionine synthetase LanC family protein, partial [Vicinamibacterales bacterium]
MCPHDSQHLTRRDVVRVGAASLASLVALPPSLRAFRLRETESYIDSARRARAWLAATAQRGPHGLTWAADPLNPKSESYDLYNGMPGVVLFLLEYAHATGDAQALTDAAQAATTIVGVLDVPNEQLEKLGTGLYVGVAGLAYVLHETY